MRLIQTSTITAVEFPPDRIPSYAILSHTWGEDEILLTDIQNETAQGKAAWDKVKSACRQAISDGYDYTWIDTCCIDKTSSAELSETLNSMYTWYENASICYTYLSDVSANTNPHEGLKKAPSEPPSEFEKSRWFTRGWTLQELLAPRRVIFFSRDWVKIGEKSDICGVLSRITRIDEKFLMRTTPLESASVAKRMSWAADRRTTRPEDIAYCLMGIFSINMPMLYGEGGERAFLRLQEEIMKQSDDQSIFAWTDSHAPPETLHGLLATAPSFFADCHNIVSYEDVKPRPPYAMTNRGLRIDLPLTTLGRGTFLAALYCPVPPDYVESSYLGIVLKRLSVSDRYVRINIDTIKSMSQLGRIETVYVPQRSVDLLESARVLQHPIYHLRQLPSPSMYRMLNVVSDGDKVLLGSAADHLVLPCTVNTAEDYTPSHYILFERIVQPYGGLAIMLGVTMDGRPCFGTAELTSPLRVMRYNHTFEAFRSQFKPQLRPRTPGTTILLRTQRVRVDAEPQAHSKMKDYMVDITANPIEPPKKEKTLKNILGFKVESR